MQKLPTAETSAWYCSKESCTGLASRVLDDAILKDGSGRYSRGSCKSPKTCNFLSSGSTGCCLKRNITNSETSLVDANETIVHQHCNEDYKVIPLDMTEMRASSGNSNAVKETAIRCCSKGGCKVSLNKKIPSPTIETSKDSNLSISNGSRAVNEISGCCSNESYKSSNHEKETLSKLTQINAIPNKI
jgi:hypothetical protein